MFYKVLSEETMHGVRYVTYGNTHYVVIVLNNGTQNYKRQDKSQGNKTEVTHKVEVSI